MSTINRTNFVVDDSEAKVNYTIKVLDCKNGYIDIRKYRYPLTKLKAGYEKIDKRPPLRNLQLNRENQDDHLTKKGRTTLQASKSKEIRFDSLARTRRNVIELTAQNADKFKSFITLTFKENVSDVKEANKAFNIYITQVRRYCNEHGREFYYIAVPEFQKRGAVHYHMLCSEACGSELIPYHEEPKRIWSTKKKCWRIFHYFDLKYWKKGFSQAIDLDDKKQFDDQFNLALYMCEYLYKDLDDRLFNHTKLLKSNNLENPTYRYLLSDKIYNAAIEYITRFGDYKVNVYQTKNPKPGEQVLNEFTSHSVLLDEFDHQYIIDLIKLSELYSQKS